MERKLLKLIMTPAMIVAWVTGLYLAWEIGAFTDGWLHAKLALVLGMSGFHGFCAARVRAFAEDRNDKTGRYYRFANEIPTLVFVVIVALVILKPF